MSTPLSNLLARGYFPKELPPPFNTKLFGSFAGTASAAILQLDTTKKGLKNNLTTRPATHNLARSGTLRRMLTIPNPVNQYQVAQSVAKGWRAIKSACAMSSFSLTTPRYTKHSSRVISPSKDFDVLPLARAHSTTASRYMLTTDLSQFYPSIYTHSIPWALHSKPVAKAKPFDYSLIGNELDLAIRNGQDKQTIGIPIGPDTSLAIAETILSTVDAMLQGPIASRGFRYIDDIGCGFQTIAEAEDTLGQLQHYIGYFQLQLNPKKTKITELPLVLEPSWVTELRLFAIRTTSASSQQTDLLSYFSRAFELASVHREESILQYSVRRLRSTNIYEKNWQLYESLLLQCISVEPGTAPAVIGELYKYHALMPLNLDKISESLRQLIEVHAPLRHGSEVVWALWGCICLNCKLEASILEKALLTADPCVALTVLHAITNGLALGTVDVSSLNVLMCEDELTENNWLLAYEANIKGWLPNLGGKDFVAASKHFGPMKAAGVSFYDTGATLAIAVKAIATQGYDETDNKFDLGEVSG